SELPYVFFKSVTSSTIEDFPKVLGMKRFISLNSGDSSREISIASFLDLKDSRFISSTAVVCNAFSKVERKGNSLELSGTDTFNKIVLPLASAIDYAAEFFGRYQMMAILAHAVCVMDAPMILAEALSTGSDLTLTPWVRIVRQENPTGPRARVQHYVVDVVHN